jgi:hypothetical protein
MTSVILKRAIRAFIAAFIAGVTAQLSAGVTINSLEDLKKLSVSLGIAGMTSALMMLDKFLRFRETDITVRALPNDEI